MKELGKRGTALMVIGLVIAVGVLLCGAGITMFIPLKADNWRFWVALRITLQVGIAFGLGLLIAKAAELPWAWMGGASIVVGLLAAWSATPDLIEGPVAIDGYVTELRVSHGYGRTARYVDGVVCFQTDAGVKLCLHPDGVRATEMPGKVACPGHLHAVVLRHLGEVLEAKCTRLRKYEPSNVSDEKRRQARRARIALDEVRQQTDKDRQAWAAQLATADPDLFEGMLDAIATLDAAKPVDRWFLPAFEGAIVQRTDVLGRIAAGQVVIDFPEQARAMAKRLHDHGGYNVPVLESELKKGR